MGKTGHMPSRVATKVISAVAVAVIVELTDLVLDKFGLPADRFRIARKILKSGISAASGTLVGKVLREADAGQKPSSGPRGRVARP
jgi:hypothetical protein